MNAATSTIAQQALMDTTNAAARKYPQAAARIARAGQILLADGVRQVTPTLWLVASQSDAAVSYAVTSESCSCQDFQHRRRDDYSCKHMLSVWLYSIAQERAAILAARQTPDPAIWSPTEARRLLFVRWLVQAGKIGGRSDGSGHEDSM